MMKRGWIKYAIRDQWFDLREGQILMIGPDVQHAGHRVELSPSPLFATCRFMIPQSDHAQPIAIHAPLQNADRFGEMFQRQYQHFKTARPGISTPLCSVICTQILYELVNELTRPEPSLHRELAALAARLQDRLDERLSIAEMCQLAGWSRNTLFRLFRERYGMSPVEYQIRQRIKYATFLLQETPSSVKQIAYELGYPDPFSFSKQFRQVTGMSPSHARTHASHDTEEF